MDSGTHKFSPTARFLIVRLGSLGDIVHAMHAVHALRATYPEARVDWLVERKWLPLIEANPDVTEAVVLERDRWNEVLRLFGQLRASKYDCAMDFQGLYKSAACTFFSGAPLRIGLAAHLAREGGASLFYTDKRAPQAAHVVDQNLGLAARAGAATESPAFPALQITSASEQHVQRALAEQRLDKFYVLNPGGGWRSKCWPAEQYGHLHRRLAEKHGLRGVVSFGPGEKSLAEAVRMVAGDPPPVLLPMDLPQLMAALRRSEFVVAADTGPLHFAAALGTPVVALFGPTDPARNGPYTKQAVVVRNAKPGETTYKRGEEYSSSMQSIRVEQVVSAVEELRGSRA